MYRGDEKVRAMTVRGAGRNGRPDGGHRPARGRAGGPGAALSGAGAGAGAGAPSGLGAGAFSGFGAGLGAGPGTGLGAAPPPARGAGRAAGGRGGRERAPLPPVTRTTLNDQVYEALRAALLEGRLRPRQRLKIRDLAAAMAVSETPVREAVVQLAREGALLLQAGRSVTVPRPSAAQYLELRRVRLALEGLAAEEAARHVTEADVVALERLHARMARAEAAGRASEAVRANWLFHAGLYRRAAMPELFGIVQRVWLRVGPLITYMYPHAPPDFRGGRHRHLDVLDRLRARDGAGVRAAIVADTVEGGARLLALLEEMDAGRVDEVALVGVPPAPRLHRVGDG